MTAETVKSYCRLCQAFCGYDVTIEDGRIVRLKGDKNDASSEGYFCFKGMRTIDHYHSSERVKRSLVRREGKLVEGDSREILAEAGDRLAAIVRESGPESVGFFTGTQSLFNTLDPFMVNAFAAALGTPRVFTTMTIDQSAKWIAEARLGGWHAGPLRFEEADVWMIVGSNPVVTKVIGGGAQQFVFSHPNNKLKRARERGMKLIVVDPRETETARMADLHLQPRPGRDAELAAAILHVIFREGWCDADFCERYVNGFDDLKAAVAHFSPGQAAQWVGVSAQNIELAAAIFARDGSRGMTGTGTGVDMARYSNLAEHLWQAVNVVCGRFPREGEQISNPGVIGPPIRPRAEVIAPRREWEQGPKTKKHGLGLIKGGMMSAEISNEILHDGPDRLRAMICVGGNLQIALPDQALADRALSELDLLIVIDPYMTGTVKAADFVIAPTMHYERPDHTLYLEQMFQMPFAHYTPALVPPPADADVVDDYYALWSLAGSLGLQLKIGPVDINMEEAPTAEQLLDLLAAASNVPLDKIRSADGGVLFEVDPVTIAAPDKRSRFELLPGDVADELCRLREEFEQSIASEELGSDQFILTVRRHLEVMNSTGTQIEALRNALPVSHLYMHPDDIAQIHLQTGSSVTVQRGEATVISRLKPDPGMRRGVVAMSHGWSGDPGQPDQATNALVDADHEVQSINRMPVMTGLPVSVRPA